jgi:hypothetical protein
MFGVLDGGCRARAEESRCRRCREGVRCFVLLVAMSRRSAEVLRGRSLGPVASVNDIDTQWSIVGDCCETP